MSLAAAGEPSVVRTIGFPGRKPVALAVDEDLGKLFVTEDSEGLLYIIDATTGQTIETLSVGGFAIEMVANQSHDKVYAFSSSYMGTPGVNSGTGLISVIDAKTNSIIKTIDSGAHGTSSFPTMANDEVRGRVWVASAGGIGYIDAATDEFTQLTPRTFLIQPYDLAVNTITNKAYVAHFGTNEVFVVDGATGDVSAIDLDPTGGRHPVTVAVGETANKVYVTMLYVPGGSIGILVLDRNANTYKFVGESDLEPLVFNQMTNRLFSGVQIGQCGAIVDGATDALTYVDLGGNGIGVSAVRSSTDNAYHANTDTTYVINGTTRCVVAFPTGGFPGGGLSVPAMAIDESHGVVYVSNDHRLGQVSVIQDGDVPCRPPAPPVLTSTVPTSPANDNLPRIIGSAEAKSTVRVYATPDCSGAVAASGTSFDLATLGLQATVADNSSTTFRATATDADGRTSGCSSSSIAYVEQSPDPQTGQLTGGATPPAASPPGQAPPALPPGQAPPAPPLPLPFAVNRVAPLSVSVKAGRVQRVLKRGVVVEVECASRACTARVSGTVSASPSKRTASIAAVTRRIETDATARVTLKLSAAVRRFVVSALQRRRTPRVRIVVRATDAAGNAITKRATVTVRQ